jgi:hypothetical protein
MKKEFMGKVDAQYERVNPMVHEGECKMLRIREIIQGLRAGGARNRLGRKGKRHES